MGPRDQLIAVVAQLAAFAAAIGLMHILEVGDLSFALIVGAIVGTQAAAVSHARRDAGGGRASLGDKLLLGVALGGAAVVAAVVVHWALAPIEYPEVVIPIGAAGTAVFPVVLFETLRKTMQPRAG